MDQTFHLRLGDTMPDLIARSTHGELPFLSWQSSSWLLIWVYPAAFTPVAVTEFQALSKQTSRLKELDTKVVGLSPDSIHALMVWHRELSSRFSAPIDFPLASDSGLNLCRRLGMIHNQASAEAPIRGTIILDPKRTVRFLAHYPLANGRSVEEITRILAALQHSDANHRPTPAGWKPGQQDLALPPGNAEILTAEEKFEPGEDFYFRYA